MKVLVESYGCTLNRGEAEEFAESASQMGHEIVDHEAGAGIYVIFTCGVIETTERRMLRRIAQLSRTEHEKFLVCGCLGNINPAAIREISPDIKIFGPARNSLVLEELADAGGSIRFSRPSSVGMLPISTGCSGSCTYCITRKARGPLSSRSPDMLRERMEVLVGRGLCEIQLCAQDTAIYGRDMGITLADLIYELETVEGDFMFRIGMMNPANAREGLDSILEAYTNPRVFKFLHLPVQSGSDKVLERMNRQHTVKDFNDVVNAFRGRFPEMVLSTDIIVGFPGETEADFNGSVGLVKEIKPDIINITRFSPRPGTPAAEMENQVPGWASKERSRGLTDLRFEITGKAYSHKAGLELKALATEYRVEGTTFLRTMNYRPVVVDKVLDLGNWYNVAISGSEKTHLTGDLIPSADKNV